MNIRLANILERTREIGVRRVMGARRRDIWQQFLIEALTISFVGRLIGVMFGFAASRVVALYAEWNTVVTGTSIAMSFSMSAAVELIFGIYPAVRAFRLDPVERLGKSSFLLSAIHQRASLSNDCAIRHSRFNSLIIL